MSCNKRKLDLEDSFEFSSFSSKRICSSEDGSSSSFSESVSNTPIENQRIYSDDERKRVLSILEKEFDQELKAKEEEVIEIQERIQKTQKILQYLCYAVVSDFYSREKTISSVVSTRQRRIHPAVKKLLSGKSPAGLTNHPPHSVVAADSVSSTSSSQTISHIQDSDKKNKERNLQSNNDGHSGLEESSEKKVPRYIPPKPKTKTNHTVPSEPVRGGKNKVKTLLLVGNVSKWIPPDAREDAVTHKWMVYVRGPKESPDISSFVSKVRFFLHPSYRPNDVVQVVCPPFQLSRRGWGEFPVRVQIHFSNPLNKPVDIIHNLKLDRTYSGLQTLGAETVAEVWIQRNDLQNEVQLLGPDSSKLENCEITGCELEGITLQNHESSTIVVKEEPRSPSPCTTPPMDADKLTNIVKSEVDEFENVTSSLAQIESSLSSIRNDQPIVYGSPIKQEALIQSHVPESPSCSTINSICTESTAKPNLVACDEEIRSEMSLEKGQNDFVTNTSKDSTPAVISPPVTRLVKCVDSKGNVRLVKMNSEVLNKLLKSGNVNTGKQVLSTQSTAIKGCESSVNTIAEASLRGSQVNQTAIVPQTTTVSASPISRPVLRLVRPSGNVKAGSMLIATNPGTPTSIQAPIGARFSTPSNGDRPVLVVKDGKLFLMKNVANTNIISTTCVTNSTAPLPAGAVPCTIPSSGNQATILGNAGLLQSNVIRSASITNSAKPSFTTSVVASVSNPKTVSSVAESAINGGCSQKLSTTGNVPSLVYTSPRTAVTSSTAPSNVVLNMKSQLGRGQVMQMKKNGNRVVLVSNTTAHLSKPSNPTHSRSLIKPGMSLLKSGVSLLKTNIASSSSSSNFVQSRSSSSVSVSSPQSAVSKRIILGRASGPSTISTTSHRAQQYQEQLLHAVKYCPRGVGNVWRAVRWMVRFFPLINLEAHLNEFKILHPFCAPTENIFCSWNIGKQRACEWLRAKSIRQALIQAGWETESVWTTREIILWARFHGYTPGLPSDDEGELKNVSEENDDENSAKTNPFSVCVFSESIEAEAWLQEQEKNKPCNSDLNDSESLETEEEVDIISCDTSPSKANKQNQRSSSSQELFDEMPLEPSLHAMAQFVSDTLKRCGYKNLSGEEISPGVLYPAAQRMMVQALQSLVEDLIRRAYADAWGENISKQPSIVDVKNVCGALLHRPEFDLFTCYGLGIHPSDP